MGWEFAALWVDDPDSAWHWVWRRVADDSGGVIQESHPFQDLALCVADAKEHGFDEDGCGSIS
ncbi:MAG: hypothetical protein JWN13_2482 [Betaproteobacteria bacterium]|jgi:hypothetical protein|nr:hypothetical protein [Betaproteobacteria bacterium]